MPGISAYVRNLLIENRPKLGAKALTYFNLLCRGAYLLGQNGDRDMKNRLWAHCEGRRGWGESRGFR